VAFDIYGNKLRRGYCEVHPDVKSPYPCYYCLLDAEYEHEREPELEWEPTDEEICAGTGHKYDGDDEEGGRCYCGKKRYPAGGPQFEKFDHAKQIDDSRRLVKKIMENENIEFERMDGK